MLASPSAPTGSPTAALMSTDEAAKYLSAKPLTLVAWRHKKQGPAYVKMGGQVRYRQGDLDAYIAQSVRTTGAA